MIKKNKNNKLSPDLIIDFFITGRCDMKCPFCYGADNPIDNQNIKEINSQEVFLYKPSIETINITGLNESRPELTFDQITKLLITFAELGLKKINIGGGEPLLRKDTPEIIKIANNLDISVYLSTNGTYLSTRYKEIKDNIKVLGLPLDGSNKKMNNLMGRASYMIDNVKSILVYLDKEKPDHKIKIGTIVSKINIDDIENIGVLLYETPGISHPDIWRIYQFEKIERGENNAKRYEIDDQKFWSVINHLKKRFPQANIAPRANSDHNNAYFFVSPDGMLQLVDNKHRSILDTNNANKEDIYETITKFQKTIKKTINNREWTIK
ncbi:MAG: radical SAM protein [Candidatus Shapirobacteria bacterium]|nr:radical SAM protein [Candidatus Shapirobacteria bacterium]MDD4410752.1 radical SAM protein [Candidatus Shapirobacteria bacterium]